MMINDVINYASQNGSYLLLGLGVFLLFLLGYELYLTHKKERMTYLSKLSFLLLTIYLSILFSVTISPVYGFHLEITKSAINLLPGKVLQSVQDNPLNFVGNIIMFIPIGFLLPAISKRYENGIRACMIGFCLSVIIELIQLFLARGTDIDDVILNTAGTIVGYGCYRMVRKVVPVLADVSGVQKKATGRKMMRDGNPVVWMMMLLIVATILNGFSVRRQMVVADEKPVLSVANKSVKKKLTRKLQLSLKARNVAIYDVEDQVFCYQERSSQAIAPASTAKMLTALTVAKYLSPDEKITVGDEIALVAKDASRAGIHRNNILTVKQLLEGMLLPSGNDAAYTLAVHTGRRIGGRDLDCRQAIQVFVEQMNEESKRLGATHSYFISPDGYDEEGQYSTAEDLCIIASTLLKSSYSDGLLKEIVSKDRIRECFVDGTDVTWNNTNELLSKESEYYNSEVIGLKTGSSASAGKCLVSAAYINNKLYISAVMGDSEKGRYLDSNRIYAALK
ncbi:D-alanyl-D-alanine carboxypeptidase [Lachnospiraceae bacterium KM106-2]|nr:D-alanyl-D-alanine carboxypeptidase [Lachnospiraceae bacterium KM106-2]